VHGNKNRQIKIQQLARQEPSNCGYCYKVDSMSESAIQSASNRSWYKKMCADTADSGIYSSPDNFDPQILDLRWRNTCNLACVYCGPTLSSRWAQEIKKYPRLPSEQRIEQTKSWIFSRLDTIRHVYMAGGEPLLIKENLELLNLLQTRRPDINIRINTNLINIDTPVFKKLQEFPQVRWTVSVENIGDQFNYTRYPGDWRVFESNLQHLTKLSDNINFNLTWSIVGAIEIFDCIDYLLAQGYNENMFVVNVLESPSCLDVNNLSAEFRDKISDLIKNRLAKSDPSLWLHKSLSTMYNCLQRPTVQSDPRATLDYIRQIDQRRGLDFSKIFPEIYRDLMQQSVSTQISNADH
jgi:sulfatase maturation enzyme AslB (radical SAM superfamily)